MSAEQDTDRFAPQIKIDFSNKKIDKSQLPGKDNKPKLMTSAIKIVDDFDGVDELSARGNKRKLVAAVTKKADDSDFIDEDGLNDEHVMDKS